MQRELSPQEKRLIERELIARQEADAKRRAFAHRVFLVGILAGSAAGFLDGFRMRGAIEAFGYLVWIVCSLTYVGGKIFPTSLREDLDPAWHLNPWQNALQNLGEGRTIGEAIALLACTKLAALLGMFCVEAFR